MRYPQVGQTDSEEKREISEIPIVRNQPILLAIEIGPTYLQTNIGCDIQH